MEGQKVGQKNKKRPKKPREAGGRRGGKKIPAQGMAWQQLRIYKLKFKLVCSTFFIKKKKKNCHKKSK